MCWPLPGTGDKAVKVTQKIPVPLGFLHYLWKHRYRDGWLDKQIDRNARKKHVLGRESKQDDTGWYDREYFGVFKLRPGWQEELVTWWLVKKKHDKEKFQNVWEILVQAEKVFTVRKSGWTPQRRPGAVQQAGGNWSELTERWVEVRWHRAPWRIEHLSSPLCTMESLQWIFSKRE